MWNMFLKPGAAQVGRRMLSCASTSEMRKWSTCGAAPERPTQRTPSQRFSRGKFGFIGFFLAHSSFSTQSLTAIAMAALYDEGLIDYETRWTTDESWSHPWVRISDYWPEFGQKGKEKTTVADLMRHEANLRLRYMYLMYKMRHVRGSVSNEPL